MTTVRVDAEHGGRITSLRDRSGFEWLWSRPDDRRERATPGSTFIDAGGIEECLPTIAGHPDHGDVWSRPWQERDGGLECATDDFTLTRSLHVDAEMVRLRYRLSASPGYRFVWAFHALIDPAADIELDVEPGEGFDTWPQGYDSPPVSNSWPRVDAIARFDDVSVDDGTATFGVFPERSRIEARRGSHRLEMRIDGGDHPASIGLWRNLGGYPSGAPPYRSLGLEPMLGRHPDLAQAPTESTVVVPASGAVSWAVQLTLTHDEPVRGR